MVLNYYIFIVFYFKTIDYPSPFNVRQFWIGHRFKHFCYMNRTASTKFKIKYFIFDTIEDHTPSFYYMCSFKTGVVMIKVFCIT